MTHTPFHQQLEQYRQQIDAIDGELFQLILKRADIVKQVGELKEQYDETHVKLRPAREARQLKSIHEKFSASPFPEASALMIWRHLINGSLMVESPLRVMTLESPQALPDFAREYFGCYASMEFVPNCQQLMAELENDQMDVAIFPMPAASDRDPWWLKLAEDGCKLRMFLRFPYLPTACVRDGTEAIAVSKVADEVADETSHTALVLDIASSISPMDLKKAVTTEFFDISWHCSNRTQDDSVACFVTVPYVVTKEDPRIVRVLETLDNKANRIRIVGYLPKPLERAHATA